jgi:hypothetical protein
MNWDQEIEIEAKNGIKGTVTVAEIQSLLMADLTREELEEFAGELIRWVEFQPPYSLWE